MAYFIDNRVEPTTASFLCKAKVPNPQGTLLPGEYVNIRVVDATKGAAPSPTPGGEATKDTTPGPAPAGDAATTDQTGRPGRPVVQPGGPRSAVTEAIESGRPAQAAGATPE